MDYAELERELLQTLKSQSGSTEAFSQDQLKLLTTSVDDKLKKMFPDQFNQSGAPYEQGTMLIQGMKTSDVLIMGLGAGVSGAVGGIIGSLAGGLGVSIAGINAVLVGFLARKFFAKSGALAKFFDGVIIGGIATALASMGLTQQVTGALSGVTGGRVAATSLSVASTGAETPQTAALRGTTTGMAVPAGFTE